MAWDAVRYFYCGVFTVLGLVAILGVVYTPVLQVRDISFKFQPHLRSENGHLLAL